MTCRHVIDGTARRIVVGPEETVCTDCIDRTIAGDDSVDADLMVACTQCLDEAVVASTAEIIRA